METLPVDLACKVRAALARSAVSGQLARLLCHPEGRLAWHAMTDEERAEVQAVEQLGAKFKVVLRDLYCKHGDRGERKALEVVREVIAEECESRKRQRSFTRGWRRR